MGKHCEPGSHSGKGGAATCPPARATTCPPRSPQGLCRASPAPSRNAFCVASSFCFSRGCSQPPEGSWSCQELCKAPGEFGEGGGSGGRQPREQQSAILVRGGTLTRATTGSFPTLSCLGRSIHIQLFAVCDFN